MAESPRTKLLGALLRVGVFAFIEIAGLMIFGRVIYPLAGYFAAAALSTFAAAAVANTIAVRIYERQTLTAIGLGWTAASRRNLLLGLAAGGGAALVVIGFPVMAGTAELYRVPGQSLNWGSLLFVSLLLFFGAAGEEMLFRGYGFQVLMDNLGPFATILPVGVLFGIAHGGNQYFSGMGLANTIGWGIILGTAFYRSGDLWLPIGMHFGWNWVLPLFGVSLSGFTMGVTGIATRWHTTALWSGGAYGPEASILTTLVLFGLAYFLWKAPVLHQRAVLLRSLEED
ncbi:MAG: CPBP family intramembrane metalloprotease [Bryobacterales bacterium]|nr:CPBP family intramembrane metalloprotease [Bryobacterales bacterium]